MSFSTGLFLANARRSQFVFYPGLCADGVPALNSYSPSFACIDRAMFGPDITSPLDSESMVRCNPSSLLEEIPLQQYNTFRRASSPTGCYFNFSGENLSFERFRDRWRYEISARRKADILHNKQVSMAMSLMSVPLIPMKWFDHVAGYLKGAEGDERHGAFVSRIGVRRTGRSREWKVWGGIARR